MKDIKVMGDFFSPEPNPQLTEIQIGIEDVIKAFNIASKNLISLSRSIDAITHNDTICPETIEFTNIIFKRWLTVLGYFTQEGRKSEAEIFMKVMYDKYKEFLTELVILVTGSEFLSLAERISHYGNTSIESIQKRSDQIKLLTPVISIVIASKSISESFSQDVQSIRFLKNDLVKGKPLPTEDSENSSTKKMYSEEQRQNLCSILEPIFNEAVSRGDFEYFYTNNFEVDRMDEHPLVVELFLIYKGLKQILEQTDEFIKSKGKRSKTKNDYFGEQRLIRFINLTGKEQMLKHQEVAVNKVATITKELEDKPNRVSQVRTRQSRFLSEIARFDKYRKDPYVWPIVTEMCALNLSSKGKKRDKTIFYSLFDCLMNSSGKTGVERADLLTEFESRMDKIINTLNLDCDIYAREEAVEALYNPRNTFYIRVLNVNIGGAR